MSELVDRARKFALDALASETLSDGRPFIGHPDGVASIVYDDLGLPEDCVAAIYLHEATRIHKDLPLQDYPDDVIQMVEGLNRISTIKPRDTRLEADNYKKLIVQYSTDPRVVVIKIADRLEVMRRLESFPKSSREQKILETAMLYMPLSHQLGLYNINNELGDICLRFSDPEQYRAITNKLKAGEASRKRLLEEFIRPLEGKLSSAGIAYKLKIRTKSAYSIYRKMRAQNVPFEGVYDVFAIRFIIDCDDDPALEKDLCWKVYSYVTEEYEPDTSRLRDWLTTPRPNGYESLHITVKNRSGAYLEVQIRTKRMDAEAENGSASHWSYKGIRHEEGLDRMLQSVRRVLENPLDPDAGNATIPLSNEVFVFTPTGELRSLPAGASVLDFAFSIHSGLGCRCMGGRVNGKAVPIKEKLKTGDVVEVITSRNCRPGKDWLSWVVSSKARTKIKQELEADDRKKAAEGRELLERRLKNWKLEFPMEMQTEMMKARKYSSIIAFLAAIGTGEIDVNEIKEYILEAAKNNAAKQAVEESQTPLHSIQAQGNEDILVINAREVKGIDYKMAHCCNPVYGDDVFGFVTRTDGIKIHRISCPNAARLIEKYPYRIQKVVWQDTSSSGRFQCTLSVSADQDPGVAAAIMNVIGQFKVSLRSFNINDNPRTGTSEITVRLLVPSNLELDKVVSQIDAIRQVIKVKRV